MFVKAKEPPPSAPPPVPPPPPKPVPLAPKPPEAAAQTRVLLPGRKDGGEPSKDLEHAAANSTATVAAMRPAIQLISGPTTTVLIGRTLMPAGYP